MSNNPIKTKVHEQTIQEIINLYEDYVRPKNSSNDLLNDHIPVSVSPIEGSSKGDDLTRRSFFCLLDNMDKEVKAELVAIVFLARKDIKIDDFLQCVQEQMKDKSAYLTDYLTGKPLDDYLIEGLMIMKKSKRFELGLKSAPDAP